MTVKREKFGCLSKSLEDFLRMEPDDRFDKYGYDENKYYQRIVNNVNFSFGDVVLAFDKLPKEQKDKIDLYGHIEQLIQHIKNKEADQTPDQLISTTKAGLSAILLAHIEYDNDLRIFAKPDFEKVIALLNHLGPKNPNVRGAIV